MREVPDDLGGRTATNQLTERDYNSAGDYLLAPTFGSRTGSQQLDGPGRERKVGEITRGLIHFGVQIDER